MAIDVGNLFSHLCMYGILVSVLFIASSSILVSVLFIALSSLLPLDFCSRKMFLLLVSVRFLSVFIITLGSSYNNYIIH